MKYAAPAGIWKRKRMSTNLAERLPSAKDLRKEIAVAEAETASAEMRKRDEAETEKKARIDQLSKPSGVSDEEGIRCGATIVRGAVNAA
jgi:hypothetical protein